MEPDDAVGNESTPPAQTTNTGSPIEEAEKP
jgi:hypothetical protein